MPARPVIFLVALLAELAATLVLGALLVRKLGGNALTERHAPMFVLGLLAKLCCILVFAVVWFNLPAPAFILGRRAVLFWILVLLGNIALLSAQRKLCVALLSRLSFGASFGFVLWFFVVLVLGVSLFDSVSGISTPWVNNYGDLTFHLGLVTSFAFGENYAPQYVVFAGEPLSYPFFINLWSAALWWPWPGYGALDAVFALQWVVLWCAIYAALDGEKRVLLPWALLFGGGAVHYLLLLVTDPEGMRGVFAHSLIDGGYPWTPFLTTIWTTQRAMVLGVAAMLWAVRLFEESRAGSFAGSSRPKLVMSGLILGMSPLAHVHCALVGACYTVFRLLCWSAGRVRRSRKEGLSLSARTAAVFCLSALPGLGSLPFLWRKQGVIGIVPGWMSQEVVPLEGIGGALRHTAALWWDNAPVFLAALFLAPLVLKQRISFLVLVALFALANLFQLAVWPWDQLKAFVAVYALLLVLFRTETGFRMILTQGAALLLCIPGGVEAYRSLAGNPSYAVYSAAAVERAAAIRSAIPPCSVLVARPQHNSTATLTGRRLYYGYEGTLASHGLAYQGRRSLMNSSSGESLCDIVHDRTADACAVFVLEEPGNPPLPMLNDARKKGIVEETALPYLFSVRSRCRESER